MTPHAAGVQPPLHPRNAWYYNVVWTFPLHASRSDVPVLADMTEPPALPGPLHVRAQVRLELRDIPAVLTGAAHIAQVQGDVDIPGLTAGPTPLRAATCHVGRRDQGMGIVALLPFQGREGRTWRLHLDLPPDPSPPGIEAEPAVVTLRAPHGPVVAEGVLRVYMRLFLRRLANPQVARVPQRSVVGRLTHWWTGRAGA